MSVLLEFSMSPFDKGVSLSDYIARSLDLVDRSGLPYRLNPMGTVIEGEWDDCMKLVGECFKTMSADCERVTCSIKIDYRKDADGRINAKVESVERVLGRKLKQ